MRLVGTTLDYDVQGPALHSQYLGEKEEGKKEEKRERMKEN